MISTEVMKKYKEIKKLIHDELADMNPHNPRSNIKSYIQKEYKIVLFLHIIRTIFLLKNV